MFESWIWGPVPDGYRRVCLRGGQLMLIQDGINAYRLAASVMRPVTVPEEPPPHYGRGTLRRIQVAEGNVALARQYRHGGLLRKITGQVFFTWPTRPFAELVITDEVRRRGVPTVDVLAALVQRTCGPFYRGWLVSRELAGAQDLWLALKNSLTREDTRLLLCAVAQGVRRMHFKGIYHADLNLKNIMVRRQPGSVEVFLIDFDKARLFPEKLSPLKANKNLLRLLRSVRKLDSRGQYLSEKAWSDFMEFYNQDP